MALAKLRPSVVVIIGVRLSLVVQVCSVVPNRSELLQYSSLSILVVRGGISGSSWWPPSSVVVVFIALGSFLLLCELVVITTAVSGAVLGVGGVVWGLAPLFLLFLHSDVSTTSPFLRVVIFSSFDPQVGGCWYPGAFAPNHTVIPIHQDAVVFFTFHCPPVPAFPLVPLW